ncbi:hypothetical protein B9Z55_027888 [Caenorhabditis nigoni]|uniref:Uncharacterized protein n=1 Tax=Caenorhabditis nigoni TaxID=1611254 RepID=A0A2G5SDT1_9PELO|nr:hypothetical protein B9Z55_027888 [Caenorhabditis nigoni]
MICFILKFAFIDVFEVKGNLDLNAADLEVISTSSPIFSINSNRGNVSKLSKLILEMADENILTDVQLCDPRTIPTVLHNLSKTHMEYVSRTGFAQGLRPLPVHVPNKKKFDVQRASFCFDEE